ncbi:hypothetical protein [Paractinoplanes durhamensis]|uniref:hypothetical protein n=1 Tax=Paractinoplanes durhamensis TaxID=113563 RepID=UPI0036352658
MTLRKKLVQSSSRGVAGSAMTSWARASTRGASASGWKQASTGIVVSSWVR